MMDSKDLIKSIDEDFNLFKQNEIANVDNFIAKARSILKNAVRLFWLEKHNIIPKWEKNGKKKFNLGKAIKDERFAQYFSRFLISDMLSIRKLCSYVLKGKASIRFIDLKDLFERLEKCVQAIKDALSISVVAAPVEQVEEVSEQPKEEVPETNVEEEKVETEVVPHDIKKAGKGDKTIKENEAFYVESHADLLNVLFNKGYDGWQRSMWPKNQDDAISDEYIIWMARFDELRHGWINTFINENKYKQEQTDKSITTYEGYPLNEYPALKKYRIVMAIEETPEGRRYVFKGIYKFNEQESSLYCHYFDKVSDEVTL